MDRFTLSANTLSRTVKDNLADRIEVEIGDSKQLDFKPQFKIKRWDNEVNFSMRAVEEAGATMVEEDGKVKHKGKDIEVHQYEKPEASEDGGFEFEWVLNKKPKSNILRTTIQHKGLDFKYQPALTEKQIADGLVRPENVIGSYAVYHKTNKHNAVGGKKYRTGKAFHIYRPEAIDANGLRSWCTLTITEGELTVTVPQNFLDTAAYPVVVDPTFGYTSAGASTSIITNIIAGSIFTGAAGTVTSIDAYTQNGPDGGADFLTGIYDTSYNLIADGGSNAISPGVGVTWRTFTFAVNPSVIAVDYLLIAHASNASFNSELLFFDTGTTNQGLTDANTYAGSALASFSAPTLNNNQYSIYATYTAAPSFNPAFAHRRLLTT